MQDYETPETPGASNPDGHQSGVRQMLNELVRAHIQANNAQAALLNFQITMARRLADNIVVLESQIPGAKDSGERAAICSLIDQQYKNMVAVLYDLEPDQKQAAEYESDN